MQAETFERAAQTIYQNIIGPLTWSTSVGPDRKRHRFDGSCRCHHLERERAILAARALVKAQMLVADCGHDMADPLAEFEWEWHERTQIEQPYRRLVGPKHYVSSQQASDAALEELRRRLGWVRG